MSKALSQRWMLSSSAPFRRPQPRRLTVSSQLRRDPPEMGKAHDDASIIKHTNINRISSNSNSPTSPETDPRLPRNVQSVYLRPLKRRSNHGVPTCDLQLRSYSVRNLEFFADFSLRAAYYLKLPAAGPVPLLRIVERWTVPRSNFAHKKSQENFERNTLRRLIQIRDGHPDTVAVWLAFLRKHAYYGVGMKASVWHFDALGKEMDDNAMDAGRQLDTKWELFGHTSKNAMVGTISDVVGTRNTQIDNGPLQFL